MHSSRIGKVLFGLKETMDQLGMTHSVRCYGHVLRRAIDVEVVSQGKNGRLNNT